MDTIKCKQVGCQVRFGPISSDIPAYCPVHNDKNPAAVALGSIKTEKKAVAARENGKKGGRPGSGPCLFCGFPRSAHRPRRNHHLNGMHLFTK